MNSLYKVLMTFLLVCASVAKNTTKDVIGFPEMEENPDLKNKDDRKPLFLPAMCPENELYYPGDQKDDWICDCRPGYLYHPASDACWPAFRRGPCQEGSYLLLPQNTVIPVCEKNPCNVDSYVSWNTKCEKLGSSLPCNHISSFPSTLGVNATTLVVSCVRMNFSSRLSELENTASGCPLGCKRSISGKCMPTIY